MNGPTLFDAVRERERVRSKTQDAILYFCRTHPTFHGEDLYVYVNAVAGPISPSSADRILRLLKAEGALTYIVTDRRASLYSVLSVRAA